MTENNELKTKAVRRNYTPEGRYIPVGGGSRGWINDSLVAANEKLNGYKFSSVYKKVKFFFDIEAEERDETRNNKRQPMNLHVQWLWEGEKNEHPGYCRDISDTGIQIRVRETMTKDARVEISLLARRIPTEVPIEALKLTATVVWCKLAKVSHGNTRFDAGLHFDPLDEENNYKLMMVLGGRVLELLPPLPEEGEEEEEEADPDKPIVPGIDTSRLLRSTLMAKKKERDAEQSEEEEAQDLNL